MKTEPHTDVQLPTCESCGRKHNCYSSPHCASCQLDYLEQERDEMFTEDRPTARPKQQPDGIPVWLPIMLIGSAIIGIIGTYHTCRYIVEFIKSFFV